MSHAGTGRMSPVAAGETVSGKLFRVDLAGQCCELLKETVFDPETNEGESRWPVRWGADTRFVKVVTQNSFSGIAGPVRAHIRFLPESVAEGRPWVATRVTVLDPADEAGALPADAWTRVAVLTPDVAADPPRSGRVTLAGRDVPMRLRGPGTTVEIRGEARAGDLAEGFWEAQLQGSRQPDGTFVAASMQIHPRVDPRVVDDPALPRVLVVGDSISMNYHEAAKAALKGVANYYRIDGNGGPSDRGVSCMDLWLGDYTQPGLHWDLIQFNHGLHDLKQSYDEAAGTYGTYQLSVEAYQRNLEREIAVMKPTGARLMWCSTTPVPNNSHGLWDNVPMGRKKDADLVFNAAALEVMGRHPDILVHDLNGFVRNCATFDDWRKQADVHFWDGRTARALGEAVAAAIREALGRAQEGRRER